MDGRLNDAQLAWLRNVVGDFRLVRDESWPLTTSSVWHIEDATGRGLAVKSAAPPMESHILREIGAHEAVTRPLSETGEAQTLVAASRELGMLVVSYLPGSLAGTSDARLDATVHTQAARLLARLHSCGPRLDEIYESRRLAATQKWLAADSRISPGQRARIADALRRHVPGPTRVVPTHGDWAPRNWVVEETDRGPWTKAIDFGRFGWRPAQTDLVRLWGKEWRERPALEQAFLEGYGEDPRDAGWQIECLCQAISTAGWAHMMGDEAFEREGLAMLDRALELA